MPHRRFASLATAVLYLLRAWGTNCAVLGAFVVPVVVTGCGRPVVATAEPAFLRVGGSTSMAPLLTALADGFRERNPSVHVQVTSLGTQGGVDGLARGDFDLAMASWLSPAQRVEGSGGTARATIIARDGIAVIVHPSNPLEGVGMLQLRDVFQGRAFEWESISAHAQPGLVEPVSREEGSGTRQAFDALLMGDSPVTPWAVVAPSSQAVVDYVAAHPAAIGYVSMGYLTPAVKVLEVEGVEPTPELVRQGHYPLSREFWLLESARPSKASQQFLAFVQSAAGQQIVASRYARID